MDSHSRLTFCFCLVSSFFIFGLVVVAGDDELSDSKLREAKKLLENGLDVTKLIETHGYSSERYSISTDDGYILTIFRIVNPLIGKAEKRNMKVVLLMHGLFGSPADWVADHQCKDLWLRTFENQEELSWISKECGPSLGFLLSDHQYDVWLGTVRGSVYGRRHRFLSTENQDFWNFSMDEQVSLDLPVIIKHIQRTSKKSKICYIGFEHGSRLVFGLLADKPSFATTLEPIFALAPLVIPYHVNEYHLKSAAIFERANEGALRNSDAINFLKAITCHAPKSPENCLEVLSYLLFGSSAPQLDTRHTDEYIKLLPEGTSTKVLAHYAQSIQNKQFAHYDSWKTIDKGNSSMHDLNTDYDLANLPSKNLYLFYSKNDWLSSYKEVIQLKGSLLLLDRAHEIVGEWSHFDYLFSKEKRGTQVNDRILEIMRDKFSSGRGSSSWTVDGSKRKKMNVGKASVVQIIEARNFRHEQHDVKTSDGYILTIHRIINPIIIRQHRSHLLRPIVLMHGLMGSALDWVVNSEGIKPLPGQNKWSNSLAFSLSDSYYDVWLGTFRGSPDGKKHSTFTVDDPEFWDFSHDEHIRNDLPAILRFIREKTNSIQIGYVGVGHGTLIALGLLAMEPSIGDFLMPVMALSPIAFMPPINPTLYNDFLNLNSQLKSIRGSFSKTTLAMDYLKLLVCGQSYCDDLLYMLYGFDAKKKPASTVMTEFPGDTSVKTILHYGQLIESGKFSYFDYRYKGNIRKYGRSSVPSYDLRQITSPHIYLFHSNRDLFSSPTEVKLIKKSVIHGAHDFDLSGKDWYSHEYLFSEIKCVNLNEKIISSIANYYTTAQETRYHGENQGSIAFSEYRSS